MRRVSMADVAAAAGVSGQTVSRVVNASPRVDPATRSRVEEAMARLGYRPHRAARALRTGRTQTIGLVVATLDTVGNSRMLQAVAAAAAGRGYGLAVATVAGPESADDAFARLADQGVDGAVVLNEATPFAAAVPAAAGFRLVLVDAPVVPRPSGGESSGVHVVQTDHAAGAYEATAHLLSLGHRRIAHIAGPSDSFAAAERERGWRRALAEAALQPGAPVRGDWSAASGHAAAGSLGDATAVFVANDQMALGALRALADAGQEVPRDVSVVGFDDIADAAQYRPPLTTVRQDFDALGARAVAVLIDDVESTGVTAPMVETLTPTLIVRASTAPLR
ncbi:LacI family DNA-binding transcriptional regulator [Microbacterium sp. CCNWLW134]|uniref:LacI family DNA-binding transcriptional regulator n=1 Tax=Microbacterium sp. CCNWLW134 TaxID=3122064 RepID=UPI00300FBEC3